jgi:tRNA nucleotidyltransferase (CCA-adding enzyme)
LQPLAGVTARWRHFSHQADIGVEGIGATRDAALEQAAVALTAVVTDPRNVETRTAVDVHCEAPTDDLLLVDWLNAIVFEMGTRKMVFGRFEVSTDGQRLHGRLWGETVQRDRHQPVVEIKGATYTALRVAPAADGLWHAACVLDV